MTTITLEIAVDELPDYNENGACPTEKIYNLDIIAEVDVHARVIQSIRIADPMYMMPLLFHILTERDQAIITVRILDFIENNITFLTDSLKEHKLDSDFESFKESKGDR